MLVLQFMDLSAKELKVAKALGITEAVIVSLMKRRSIKVCYNSVISIKKKQINFVFVSIEYTISLRFVSCSK